MSHVGFFAFLGFDSVGPSEVLVLLAIILIVVGPKNLPSAARKLGAFMASLRRAADEFKRQLMSMDQVDASSPQPDAGPPPPPPPDDPTPGAYIDVPDGEPSESPVPDSEIAPPSGDSAEASPAEAPEQAAGGDPGAPDSASNGAEAK